MRRCWVLCWIRSCWSHHRSIRPSGRNSISKIDHLLLLMGSCLWLGQLAKRTLAADYTCCVSTILLTGHKWLSNHGWNLISRALEAATVLRLLLLGHLRGKDTVWWLLLQRRGVCSCRTASTWCVNTAPTIDKWLKPKFAASWRLIQHRPFLLKLLLQFANRVYIVAVGLLNRVVNGGHRGGWSCSRRSELLVHLMALLGLWNKRHLRQRLQGLLLLRRQLMVIQCSWLSNTATCTCCIRVLHWRLQWSLLLQLQWWLSIQSAILYIFAEGGWRCGRLTPVYLARRLAGLEDAIVAASIALVDDVVLVINMMIISDDALRR